MAKYFYDKHKISTRLEVEWGATRESQRVTSYDGFGSHTKCYRGYRIDTIRKEFQLFDQTYAYYVEVGDRVYYYNGDSVRDSIREEKIERIKDEWSTDHGETLRWLNTIDRIGTLESKEERGEYVTRLLAENGTYPSDGKHTDGYWYVRQSAKPPSAPNGIALPGSLRAGDTITASWSGASDPEGELTNHYLEVRRNGGSWTSVATKNTSSGSSSHSYTIPSGTTSIQFRVRVKDAQGLYSSYTETPIYTVINNFPPTAIPVEPKGDLAKIAIVDTINPVLVWRFEDTDPGDAQTAYQVIVEDTNNNIVHDSKKISSSQSFYIVPDLAWATRYKWKARVWDRYDLASEYSSYQFFLPKRRPNVTDVEPGSPSAEEPAGTGTSPEFSWTFEDLDQQAQAAYQIRIYDTKDVLVYDSSRIEKTINMHKVPEGILSEGAIYYAIVTVWDPFGLDKDSAEAYFFTNSTPTAPTLTNPANTYRTGLRPTFEGLIGSDKENDPQQFIIQISQDERFEKHVLEISSMNERKGWQVSDGSQWYDLMAEGVDNSYEGKGVRYTLQVDLDEGRTYYWRMAGIDANTKARGKWSNTRCVRCGNMLQFKLKNPISTGNTAARRILIAADYYLANDGINKATMKIEVSNNALDTNPTWEDATKAYQNADYFTFTNTTKTAQQFALDIRFTFLSNDSLGNIEIRGLGFSFD